MPLNQPPNNNLPNKAGNPIQDNLSIMNPADLAMMKQKGTFNQNMTVRDVFNKLGIDVDGPADQLINFAKQQSQKGNILGKMQNIAKTPGGTPPGSMPGETPGGNMPPRMPKGMPPEQPGMENLLKGMR